MRNLRRTEAFDEFYNTLDEKTQEKVDYALTIVSQINVVSSKFIKKLENTEFYELRVSFGNEYRIILFTIDKDSIIEAREVLLLNGFMKKSTKDYKAQIRIARNIIKGLSE